MRNRMFKLTEADLQWSQEAILPCLGRPSHIVLDDSEVLGHVSLGVRSGL